MLAKHYCRNLPQKYLNEIEEAVTEYLPVNQKVGIILSDMISNPVWNERFDFSESNLVYFFFINRL